MKNRSAFRITISAVALWMITSLAASAQVIQGPTPVYTYSTYTYSVDAGGAVNSPYWVLSKGTVSDSWNSGTVYYATVYWTATGTGNIRLFGNDGPSSAIKSISISSCGASAPSFNNYQRCGTGTVTVTATPGSGGTSARWYSVSTGGVLLATGTSFTTPSLSTSKTYYVVTYNPSTGCESYPRTSVPVTINPFPGTANITSMGTACGPASVSLTGSGNNGNEHVIWYAASTGGSYPGGGYLYAGPTYVTPTLSTTTSYYMGIYNVLTGCENTNRTPITATIKPTPVITLSNVQTLCSGESTAITLASSVGGTTYAYTATASNVTGTTSESGITSISFNKTLSSTSGNSAGSMNYSITGTVNGCQSAAANAVVNVNPIPTLSVTNNLPSLCSGQQATNITLSNPNAVSGATYSWSVSPSNVSGASGASNTSSTSVVQNITSVSGTSSGTVNYSFNASYTANSKTCNSSVSNTTVTVKPIPVATITTSQTMFVGSSTSVALTSNIAGTSFSYGLSGNTNVANAAAGSTAPIAQALTLSNNASPGTVTYNVTPTLAGCSGTVKTSVVSVYPFPVVSSTATHVSMGSQATLSVQNLYDSYSWQGSAGSLGTASSVTVNRADNYKVQVTKNGVSTYSNILRVGDQFYDVNENYVVTNTMLTAITDTSHIALLPVDSVSQTVQYIDGLGRSLQSVITQGSPNKNDIVQPMVYDVYGREYRKYLPFVAGTDGSFKSGVIDASGNFAGVALNFYNNGTSDQVVDDARYFSETQFEAAPTNRPLKEYGLGQSWYTNDKPVKHAYLFNYDGTGAGQEKIIIWNIDTSGRPVRYTSLNSGYYPKGLLTIKSTKDEEGNEMREYADKSGNIILKKMYVTGSLTDFATAGNWTETYYIYDDFDKLRCVLQPELSKTLAANSLNPTTAQLKQLAFMYQYDARLRPIVKRAPGAGEQWSVYDQRNRIVLTQDSVQRAGNKWTFVKYDTLNRPVTNGIYTHGSTISRTAMSALISTTKFSEALNTTTLEYSTTIFPSTNLEILSVSYYDEHSYLQSNWTGYAYVNESLTSGTATQPATASSMTRSKLTGMKVKVIGTTSYYLKTINYYDDRGRLSQSTAGNYKSGTDRITNLYDFTGRILQTKTSHTDGSVNPVNVIKKVTYDFAGRIKKIHQNINGSADQLVAQYAYNEIGQLTDKKLHNTSGNNFLQSVDNRYTIRGLLSSINNAQLTNDGVLNTDPDSDYGDFFGMELLYENTDNSLGNNGSFNGNISAVKWKGSAATGAINQRSYTYNYDHLNRITAASFQAYSGVTWTVEAGTLNENTSYDLNGNILSLTRYQNLRGLTGLTVTSAVQALDNLTYTYASGNVLSKVEDSVSPATGKGDFKNGANVTTEYTYDGIGSLTADKNKGIDSVHYNLLNKADRVKYADGRAQTYLYDANGTKLQMKTYNASAALLTTREYVNGFVYVNDTLNFFPSPEGRVVVKNGNDFEYQYTITDHLGNARIVFSSAPPIPVPETANMEATTNGSFDSYTNRVSFDLFDHTDAGSMYTYSQKLTGGYGSQVGLAKSYKVYPGDKIKIEAYAKFNNLTSTSGNVGAFASVLLSAFGVPAPVGGEAGTVSSALNDWGSLVAAGSGGSSTGPKAFVNIVVFDKNFKLLDIAFEAIDPAAEQVGASPVVAHDYMSREYTAKEEGYVFMYLSNENSTQVDVYFDDVTMTYTPTPVIQYSEYYPFGLQTANSWTRDTTIGNKFLYNGKELQSDNDLNWYDYGARMYDPALGRWDAIDPLSDQFRRWSPYNYAMNNPIRFIDPDGMFSLEGQAAQEFMRGVIIGINMIGDDRETDSGDEDNRLNEEPIDQPQDDYNNYKGILYKNETQAYKNMWANSFRDGKPWKENFAWITKKGVLVLPVTETSQTDLSDQTILPIKRENGKTFVSFEGEWLQAQAMIHTHPDDWNSGLSYGDLANSVYYNVPIFAISEGILSVGFGKPSSPQYNQVVTKSSNLLNGSWLIYRDVLPQLPK